MSDDLHIRTRFVRDHCTITCIGELDLVSTQQLGDEIESALDGTPSTLTLDMRGLTLVSSAGIELFLDAAGNCHDDGVVYDLQVSEHGRRILDLVGLWWLGVIDDGYAAELAMRRKSSDGLP